MRPRTAARCRLAPPGVLPARLLRQEAQYQPRGRHGLLFPGVLRRGAGHKAGHPKGRGSPRSEEAPLASASGPERCVTPTWAAPGASVKVLLRCQGPLPNRLVSSLPLSFSLLRPSEAPGCEGRQGDGPPVPTEVQSCSQEPLPTEVRGVRQRRAEVDGVSSGPARRLLVGAGGPWGRAEHPEPGPRLGGYRMRWGASSPVLGARGRAERL